MSDSFELPARSPVEDKLDRLDQMFKWYADEIGLILTNEQRSFREPPRELFAI